MNGSASRVEESRERDLSITFYFLYTHTSLLSKCRKILARFNLKVATMCSGAQKHRSSFRGLCRIFPPSFFPATFTSTDYLSINYKDIGTIFFLLPLSLLYESVLSYVIYLELLKTRHDRSSRTSAQGFMSNFVYGVDTGKRRRSGG